MTKAFNNSMLRSRLIPVTDTPGTGVRYHTVSPKAVVKSGSLLISVVPRNADVDQKVG